MLKNDGATSNKIQQCATEFTTGIRKLVDIALCPTKSLKFHLTWDDPRMLYSRREKDFKENMEAKLKEEGLDAYLNEIVRTRTYLNHEARAVLGKGIKLNGIGNDKARKKVN